MYGSDISQLAHYCQAEKLYLKTITKINGGEFFIQVVKAQKE
ncbi:MAG: hypothetical protein ACI8PB_005389 [Desulforhopalus sp.]|jgi:hypothetical protein